MRPLVLSVVLAFSLLGGVAHSGELRITLPKRTKPTAVQKLNQEGVRALEKHKYDEARRLFYRAYLLDPDDPFTLNNLGYVSELSGDIDRAGRFYDLAASSSSDATVDRATADSLKGKKVGEVAGKAPDNEMQVNRFNVQAMGLLQKERAPEADLTLQKALQINPQNPFTLNNLGYTKEKEGELEQALTYYSKAAATNSREIVVVAVNRDWRGKPIAEVAAENIRKLRRLMEKAETTQARVARLNLAGVSAMNRNDHAAARQYFEQAYKLDSRDAFTLNNMGFVAEMDGDRETADFYYAKAAEARGRSARVTVATRRDVEGKRVGEVADLGSEAISARMEAERAERAREGGPVLLKRRDNTPVPEPERPIAPPNEQPAFSQPARSEIMQPLPDDQQPSQQPAKPGDVIEPLPDNQQPPAAQNPSGQPSRQPANQPAANPGNVMPPLPDNQQPPVAQNPSGQASQQPANPQQGQPADVIPPLPENQQPPAAKPPQKTKPPKN